MLTIKIIKIIKIIIIKNKISLSFVFLHMNQPEGN